MSNPDNNPRRKFIAAAGAGVAGLGFTAIAPGLHLMAVGQANAATEARKAGTASMMADGFAKCREGLTTIEELGRVTSED